MSAVGATALEGTSGGDAGHVAMACDVATRLSEPTRLRILCELLDSPRSVKELWTALALPQPTVSHHLGLLLGAGLVSRRRAGKTVVYALGPLVTADGDSLIIRAGPLQLEWRVRCP
jgi:DNA-binding transcriptional ArsR family regulator